MSKNMRVYQLARELDVESKEILRILQEQMNIDVTNHMSTINNQVAARVRQLVTESRKKKEEPQPTAKASRGKVAQTAPPRASVEAREAVKAETVKPGAEKTDQISAGALQKDEPELFEDEESLFRRREGKRVRKYKTPREITISGPVSVGDLAEKLGIKPREAVRELVSMGVMAGVNQELDVKTATRFAGELGTSVTVEEKPDRPLWDDIEPEENVDPSLLKHRPPVVTVLGHVDHGKTTLLDAIRNTNVTSQEAGGITQHIGASVVERNGKKIVFLDTPGHEAFTAMRARGAQVTDIAILVVAADDGVMPQTVEAISHAREAGVPVIVAVNKIDKPGARPDVVKQQLAEHGLVPEDWGGETICVPVSALTGEGVDDLLEMILLVAEMEEFKADPDRRARGTVIEAELDKRQGPVATVLVQRGTLNLGDAFVVGSCYGKVRAMVDARGRRVKEAGPATPVKILGLSGVPEAGEILQVVGDDRTARLRSEERQQILRTHDLTASRAVTLDDFYRQMQEGGTKELKMVLKADVQGSLEAIRGAVKKLSGEKVHVSIIHGAVGGITESDVMFASASGAIVIGFNVRPDAGARRAADNERVEIRTYRVIYDLLDDIKAAMEGLLEPEYQEVVIGHAQVRATFKVPGVGIVAGCYVTEGKIQRNSQVRVVRDGVVVHEGKVASLKRFQDDVREVPQGYDCGLGLEKFSDIKVGDELEFLVQEAVKPAMF